MIGQARTGSSGGGASGILSITVVAIAVATVCHHRCQEVDAFAPRSASFATRSPSTLFAATSDQQAKKQNEGEMQWVEESFNGEKAAASASAVAPASGVSIDDGQVRGPAEVLVYDTSLRGECMSWSRYYICCLYPCISVDSRA